MNSIKPFFPFSFKATELKSFILALAIYVVLGAVCGAILGWLSAIPILGILFSIFGTVVGLYTLIGIVLAILVFAKVIE